MPSSDAWMRGLSVRGTPVMGNKYAYGSPRCLVRRLRARRNSNSSASGAASRGQDDLLPLRGLDETSAAFSLDSSNIELTGRTTLGPGANIRAQLFEVDRTLIGQVARREAKRLADIVELKLWVLGAQIRPVRVSSQRLENAPHGKRVPRMQGCPFMIAGSLVIRSNWFMTCPGPVGRSLPSVAVGCESSFD
jgi:hypothetical protein